MSASFFDLPKLDAHQQRKKKRERRSVELEFQASVGMMHPATCCILLLYAVGFRDTPCIINSVRFTSQSNNVDRH
jgi:hypothetical protein